jgi:GH25 family lysozyme M1 (1,4-beta-N-acetylmuramidase)
MAVNPTPWLVDVSEHQGKDVSFDQIWREGYDGAIAKMTEGTGYVDPAGVGNLTRILRNSLVPGAYHFIWGGMSAKKQAQHFLQKVGKVIAPEKVILFVDVELSGNMTPNQHPTFDDVKRFLGTLEDKLPGKRLGIYSGYYWREAQHMGNPPISKLNLKKIPIIWDAHYFTEKVDWGSNLYKSVPESYWDNPAFGERKADILQFASTGRLRQFPKGVDVNATRGSLGELRAYSGRTRGKSTPLVKFPRENGLDRRWSSQATKRMVREIEYNFPVECFTYADHGRTGKNFGVDVLVAPLNRKANAKQRELGNEILHYVEDNWDRFSLDYTIFFNKMRENPTDPRFDYEPLRLEWEKTHPNVSTDINTSRHEDHVHISRLREA